MANITRPPPLAIVRSHKSKKDATLARQTAIEEAEQELYSKNLELLRDASFFGDIDPSDESVPSAWIKAYGLEEATRRHRICRAAWLPAKDAPTGLQVAKYVVGAFAKARADARRPPSLNVQLIQMVSGPQVFPEVEIVEEGK